MIAAFSGCCIRQRMFGLVGDEAHRRHLVHRRSLVIAGYAARPRGENVDKSEGLITTIWIEDAVDACAADRARERNSLRLAIANLSR